MLRLLALLAFVACALADTTLDDFEHLRKMADGAFLLWKRRQDFVHFQLRTDQPTGWIAIGFGTSAMVGARVIALRIDRGDPDVADLAEFQIESKTVSGVKKVATAGDAASGSWLKLPKIEIDVGSGDILAEWHMPTTQSSVSQMLSKATAIWARSSNELFSYDALNMHTARGVINVDILTGNNETSSGAATALGTDAFPFGVALGTDAIMRWRFDADKQDSSQRVLTVQLASSTLSQGYVALGFNRERMLGNAYVARIGSTSSQVSSDALATVSMTAKSVSGVTHISDTTVKSVLTGSDNGEHFVLFSVPLSETGIEYGFGRTTSVVWATHSQTLSDDWQLQQHQSRGAIKVDFTSGNNITVGGVPPLVYAHGVLMTLAWLVCAPLAVMSARYLKIHDMNQAYTRSREQGATLQRSLELKQSGGAADQLSMIREIARMATPSTRWFRYHRLFAILTTALTFAAFVLITVHISDEGGSHFVASSVGVHGVLGFVAFLFMLAQVTMGLLRPPVGDSDMRQWFEFVHRLMGRLLIPLMLVVVALGLIRSEELCQEPNTSSCVAEKLGYVVLGLVLPVFLILTAPLHGQLLPPRRQSRRAHVYTNERPRFFRPPTGTRAHSAEDAFGNLVPLRSPTSDGVVIDERRRSNDAKIRKRTPQGTQSLHSFATGEEASFLQSDDDRQVRFAL
ncbi:MAG: hypothetical protein MHM6MM_001839 [Cercozoa sp. M6MM]